MFQKAAFYRDSLMLMAVGFASALIGGIVATYGRSDATRWLPILVAWACVMASLLPAIALRNLRIFQGANRPLIAVAWRFPVALGSFLLIGWWDGIQRNCFSAALLTCYFITLVLESWLQIRQSNHAA